MPADDLPFSFRDKGLRRRRASIAADQTGFWARGQITGFVENDTDIYDILTYLCKATRFGERKKRKEKN